jgi:phospholipid/cholesterol/gamma-HCH transport system permease protein
MAEVSTAPRRGAINRMLEEFGDLARFSVDALRNTPPAFRYTAEILRQGSILVRGSSFFVAALCFWLGFSAVNYVYYTMKALGAVDFIGVFTGIVSPRVASEMAFSFGFAAKVGCGIVSEIGAMRISEEIDAYEAEGVSPMRYVVGARIAATLLFIPIVAGIALIGYAVGSWVDAIVIIQGLPSSSFWRYHWAMQGLPDLLYALVLMGVIAITITVVSCCYGYRASGGPAGVGAATARSLVVNIPLSIIIFSVANFMVYGIGNMDIPIGG